MVNYVSREEEAAKVVEIRRCGSKAFAVRADVSSEAEVQGMFARTVETFGASPTTFGRPTKYRGWWWARVQTRRVNPSCSLSSKNRPRLVIVPVGVKYSGEA